MLKLKTNLKQINNIKKKVNLCEDIVLVGHTHFLYDIVFQQQHKNRDQK